MATATVMAAAATTTTTTTALSKIERAHQMYREGRHEEALGLYTEALAMAKTKAQKIALHSNRAACYLKLQDFKKVGLLNQESLIDTVQNAIESKLMNSNTTRIFQIQAVSSSFASQFNSRKDTDCNTSLPGPRSFTFPPSCGVRSAKCEVRSARSRFTTLHEGSFSLCVYIKRERRGDATNDKRRAEERERERERKRNPSGLCSPRLLRRRRSAPSPPPPLPPRRSSPSSSCSCSCSHGRSGSGGGGGVAVLLGGPEQEGAEALHNHQVEGELVRPRARQVRRGPPSFRSPLEKDQSFCWLKESDTGTVADEEPIGQFD